MTELDIDQRPRHNNIKKILDVFYTIFSFETFFVLFLFAGRYKNDPIFHWIPVDITALLFGLTIIWGLLILSQNHMLVRKDFY